jgi:hypothetical protein
MATGKVIQLHAAGAAPASGGCSSASSCSSASAGCSSASSSCGSGSANDPDTLLQQQGWILRTTIGEPRLSEVVENYRAMGYEVHVERWSTGAASCTTCYDGADKSEAGEVWGTVYVRKGQPAAVKDELF